MKSTLLSSLYLTLSLSQASSSPPPAQPPNVCPQVHIFGARETTAPPGFGSAQTLVNLVTKAFPGTTSEAIDYPAAPGKLYGSSVASGVEAVVRQTGLFVSRCPDSVVIMHGYSQGAQIMDDAFCGGPDGGSLNSTTLGRTLVSDAVTANVAAIVLMGDPRHVGGLKFNVGNATAAGFAARPPGFTCPLFEDRMQSYCDSPDPFCSNGSSFATHQGYGREYGELALKFILSKVIV